MSALYAYISGLGTLFGPVVGAAVIVSVQDYLAQLGSWVTVVQGLVFVVCVMLFRKGVIGEIASLLRKPL
jgi:branched-chain amino acid transport system permease protein